MPSCSWTARCTPQAVRLPVADLAGPCDQRGGVVVQGGAGAGRATCQQAEFIDRRADVGEGQLALAVDDLLVDPLDAGHDRLVVVPQASGLHRVGDELALNEHIASQVELQYVQKLQELGLIEPGMSRPASTRLASLGLRALLVCPGTQETASRIPVLEQDVRRIRKPIGQQGQLHRRPVLGQGLPGAGDLLQDRRTTIVAWFEQILLPHRGRRIRRVLDLRVAGRFPIRAVVDDVIQVADPRDLDTDRHHRAADTVERVLVNLDASLPHVQPLVGVPSDAHTGSTGRRKSWHPHPL
ncbi:hypothetical protein [Streptomyces sp. NPDC005485]|uniref:hypothetical protein n=1 Tax=Streptomyces sp. NPDC005485 TaxID=3155591 RepID=UPI0033BC639E